MHSAHSLFASRPLPMTCTLTTFFDSLEKLDEYERHRILGPVYQQFLRSGSHHFPTARTDEEGMQMLFDQFKNHALALDVDQAFVTTGIIANILAWLYAFSDDKNTDMMIELNRANLLLVNTQFEDGKMTAEDFDRIRGELEERLNNLAGEMDNFRKLYEKFCEDVMSPLL